MNEFHLNNIQTGTEIVAITLNSNGTIKSYGVPLVVGEYSENHKKWRLNYSSGKNCGLLPPDGAGYMFMQKRDTPPSFYYSANPQHIKEAKRRHEKAEEEAKRKRENEKAKLAELCQKISNLLEEYGANITPIQLEGDTQGVELGISINMNSYSREFDEL